MAQGAIRYQARSPLLQVNNSITSYGEINAILGLVDLPRLQEVPGNIVPQANGMLLAALTKGPSSRITTFHFCCVRIDRLIWFAQKISATCSIDSCSGTTVSQEFMKNFGGGSIPPEWLFHRTPLKHYLFVIYTRAHYKLLKKNDIK